jgi:hypothetical protein
MLTMACGPMACRAYRPRYGYSREVSTSRTQTPDPRGLDALERAIYALVLSAHRNRLRQQLRPREVEGDEEAPTRLAG